MTWLYCQTGRAAVRFSAATNSAERARAAAEQAQTAGVTADDIVTICWTSGTEAQPKGVPRSHNEWIIMGDGVVDAADLAPVDDEEV